MIDEKNYKYLKLEFLDDKLVGAQCVGMTDQVGMLRGLIQTGFHLGPWKDRLMASPERLRDAYVAVAQGNATAGPLGLGTKPPVAKAAA